MLQFDRTWLWIGPLILGLTASTAVSAQDFRCPSPAQQVGTEVKGDLEGQAQTLIKLGTAEIKGKFETKVIDLFSKYSNSDQVAIAQNFLSPACNFLKTSNIPGEQKFEKWLQIAPLLDKYFPEKRSSVAPEPKETAGTYIIYNRTFFEAEKIADAFTRAGIRFDTKDSTCRTCKSTVLFCDPAVKRETIVKVALTLVDAGLKVTRITPGDRTKEFKNNDAHIELLDNGAEDAPSLTREQVLSISDCKRSYSFNDPIQRTISVTNKCGEDVIIAFEFSYLSPGYMTTNNTWSSPTGIDINPGETVVLMDENNFYVLIENSRIYYYAQGAIVSGDGAMEDPKLRWKGKQGDGSSVVFSHGRNKRKDHFLRADLTPGGDSSLALTLKCASGRPSTG